MFTGIIQDIGAISRLSQGGVSDIWIESHFEGDFVLGESIACDGVCLTVVESRGMSFRVQAAPETLRRSTAGQWAVGTRLNLERALRVGDRLGGHWVLGHVDGVAKLQAIRPEGDTQVLTLSLPTELSPFFIEKGSVCLGGISLTLTHVDARSFSVMVIPETLQRTTLGQKRVGDLLNLEADLIGKYVAKMLGARSGNLSLDVLRNAGF